MMRVNRVNKDLGLLLTLAAFTLVPGTANAASFIDNFHHIRTVASTVPKNGDVNPYGVAVSPVTKGKLEQGNILISNFNDSGNFQGTGTTIVQIEADGEVSLFAQIDASKLPGACPGGVGLTTALVVLRSGWVIVGSLPTAQGVLSDGDAGCLIVLNAWGRVVETISGNLINGPWDMTAFDAGGIALLFVTNVLNGTVDAGGNVVPNGTVVRLFLLTPDNDQDKSDPKPFEIGARTVIASGFGEHTDPNALVVGPTGVGLYGDTLYVADTVGNRIAAIPQALFRNTSAGTGNTVFSGAPLNGPLGLAIAPNGDILTVNGVDGNLVETTPGGAQAGVQVLDNTPTTGEPNGFGTLFGLAVAPGGDGVYFVDDGTNTLNLLH